MSTACLGQSVSGDKICLFPEEMDYFLKQDLTAKKLIIDTTEYRFQIRQKNIDISLLKANEDDLKTQVKNQILISVNLKNALSESNIKYNKANDKLKRRGGLLIGSVTLNLLFLGGVFLMLR